MLYNTLGKDRIRKNFQEMYKSEEELGEDSLNKSEQVDILEKGRKAEPIGSRKTWGNKEYVKTAQGWKASAAVKSAHDAIHKPKESPKEESTKGDNTDFKKLLSPEVVGIVKRSVEAAIAEGNDSVNIDTGEILSRFMDKLSPMEYKAFDHDKAEDFLLDYADKVFESFKGKKVDLPKSGANTNAQIAEANKTREQREHGEELKVGDQVVVNPGHKEAELHGKVVESYGVNGIKVEINGKAAVYDRKDVVSKEKHGSGKNNDTSVVDSKIDQLNNYQIVINAKDDYRIQKVQDHYRISSTKGAYETKKVDEAGLREFLKNK